MRKNVLQRKKGYDTIYSIPQSMEDIHNTIKGKVVEAFPGSLFSIAVIDESNEETETITQAYISGRMKIKKIRVLVGDMVVVKQDPYGGKGRIIQRL